MDCFDERELFTHSIFSAVFIKLKQVSEIIRKLKEKKIYTDVTDGCPQADGGGEQLSINDD